MRSQRLMLWFIVAAFTIPMIAAYMAYRVYQDGGFHTTNRGILIQPPIHVEQFRVNYADGRQMTLDELNGEEIRHRWVLIYLAPAVCQSNCLQITHALNQIHLALGKNNRHLLPLFVLPSGSQLPIHVEPAVDYVTARKTAIDDLVMKLPIAERPSQDGGLYLIDPHGFLMMAYRIHDSADNVLKDCQHLIRG